jgi:hypothetical protein
VFLLNYKTIQPKKFLENYRKLLYIDFSEQNKCAEGLWVNFKRDRETFTSTVRALKFFTGKSSEKRVEDDFIQKREGKIGFKRKIRERARKEHFKRKDKRELG